MSKEELPSKIDAAKHDIVDREAAVRQAQAALDQAKVTALQDLGTAAQTTLTKSEDLLDTLFGVLVHDASARRTSSTATFEVYFRLYNDIALRDQTVRAYEDAEKATEDMRDKYGNSLPGIRDAAVLAAALNDARRAASAVHALAETTYQLLQGATDDPTELTVKDINALKQSVTSARTTAAALMTDADAALSGLTANGGQVTSIAVQQKADAVTAAQNALKEAQNNLVLLQTQNPADLQKLADSIEQMKASLASKQAALASTTTSTDVNIRLKQNDIAQKATSAQKAAKTLQDYQLVAPFDGVVTHIDYKRGDNLLDTGDTESATLQNPDFIVVTIPLDQVDIVRVRKDMNASIAFDALPGQTFTGAIDTIDSTPIENSGVVSYNVSIKLPTPKDLTILSGMTATVTIETSRKENVLAVPALALRAQGTRTTVQTADGRTVPVVTGATDGQFTEIVSGLQEGDSVVSVNVVRSAAANSTGGNSAQQFLRLGGGGGFGGNRVGGRAGGG